MGPYVASKHGIVVLTKTAAHDSGSRGIRVSAVGPGPIDSYRLAGLPEEIRQKVTAGVPEGRLGTLEEIAALVAWLCSDQTSFITGVTFPIDGGKLAALA